MSSYDIRRCDIWLVLDISGVRKQVQCLWTARRIHRGARPKDQGEERETMVLGCRLQGRRPAHRPRTEEEDHLPHHNFEVAGELHFHKQWKLTII